MATSGQQPPSSSFTPLHRAWTPLVHDGTPGQEVQLFHEQQWLLNCAIHCLNNLFQERWLTAAKMDELAEVVKGKMGGEGGGWWGGGAYRCLIPGVGNWDIAVVVEALGSRGCRMARHLLGNKRLDQDLEELAKSMSSRQGGEGRSTVGLIINLRTTNLLRRIWDGRHWLAIIPVWRGKAVGEGGDREEVAYFYNVDSKLDRPLCIGSLDALLPYLKRLALEEQGQIFHIVYDNKGDGSVT